MLLFFSYDFFFMAYICYLKIHFFLNLLQLLKVLRRAGIKPRAMKNNAVCVQMNTATTLPIYTCNSASVQFVKQNIE